ncbi:hypothetical protein BFW86_12330 [Pseudomonas fluorescens]|nr:hypothetical protein BFW86_12330 [Pseudomonas fluorescens]
MDSTQSPLGKGLHNAFIRNKLPGWVQHLTQADFNELSRARVPGAVAEGTGSAWFEAAGEAQRQVIRQAQQRSRASNQRLAATLKGLMGVTAFAKPLLEQALQDQFGLTVNVSNAFFYHDFEPLPQLGLFKQKSLLEYALRNFERDQTFPVETVLAEQGPPVSNDLEPNGLYAWSDPARGDSARNRIDKLAIKPAEFATLCRTLDIGKQYQDHLTALFDAPASAAVVRSQTIQAWKDSLLAHAHVALLRSDISATAHTMLYALFNGEGVATLDGEPVIFSQLHVLGSPVSELFVLGARRRKGKKIDLRWSNPGDNLFEVLSYNDSRIVVCIPGDPVAPIKEYPSLKAFASDLGFRLRDETYQRFFLRFIPYGEAGKFLGNIKPALQVLKWNADIPYVGGNVIGRVRGVYEWVYREVPELNLSESFFEGPLFSELYTRHQKRLKETSQQLAVPTSRVDHDAWTKRLNGYLEWGLDILNVAAFFVPGLGEVMLAVTAVQLTQDIYHGVERWSVGDTDKAWDYLSSVASNLAFMTVVGAAVSKAPRIKPGTLVDGLVQVRLPFGDEQLWRPGLEPYQNPTRLPAGLKPNALGQYEVDGKTYLRLDGHVYESAFDPSIRKWRLKHPTNPKAYQPILEHNGQGAWRHRFERPLEWNRDRLLRRLGHATDGLDPATLRKIAHISGTDDAALRKMYMDNLPMPSALSDTLRQFHIDRVLNEMLEQTRLGQPVPDNRYNYALPQVVNMPRWPRGRVIEVFDNGDLSGASFQYGQASRPPKPVIRISHAQVSAAKLPSRILETLEEDEIVGLLGPEGARVESEREQVLCGQLAEHLTANKTSVFDSILKGSEAMTPRTPQTEVLQHTFPGLSTEAACEVWAAASVDEQLHIRRSGRLPGSLMLKARARARLARLNKAMAGLHLDSMATLDSQRLALHTLEKLPGWLTTVRLEVRQGHIAGKMLDSIGSPTAKQIKYLVKGHAQHPQASQFQAFDALGNTLNSVPSHGDNFFASIMHALPDSARVSLGLPQVGQGGQLQKIITDYAMAHRDQMLKVLLPHSPRSRFKPPVRLDTGQAGYPLSGRGAGAQTNPALALVSRVRDVLANISDEDAERVVLRLLGEGRTETQASHALSLYAREHEELTTQLEAWVSADPNDYGRRGTAGHIRDAWRSRVILGDQVPFYLDLRASPHLPELSVDLSNVGVLRLSYKTLLGPSLDISMRPFSGVRSVEVDMTDFSGARTWSAPTRAQIVSAFGQMPAFKALIINGEGEGFTQVAQAVVNNQPGLEQLTLRGVAREVDVSHLNQLRSLVVAGSADAWPKGVLQLPHLERLDLRELSITELPTELFSGYERVWRGLSVNWSNLSRESFEVAYRYVQEHPAHLLDAHAVLTQYARGLLKQLVPDLPRFADVALNGLQRQGLSDEALLGRINALDLEHAGLVNHLRAWQARPAIANELNSAQNRRPVAAQILECWQEGVQARLGAHEPVAGPSWRVQRLSDTLDLPGWRLGDLPTLTGADFNHVRRLCLPGAGASLEQLDSFVSHFTGLRRLELSGNQLAELPPALERLPQLTYLDVSYNDLTVTTAIQNRLNRLPSLETLNLRFNRVQRLDVRALTALTHLDLAHTALRTWPTGALQLPSLRRLDLSHSAITSVPEALFTDHEPLLDGVQLQGCRLDAPTLDRVQRYAAGNLVPSPLGIARPALLAGRTGGDPEFYPVQVSEQPDLLLPLPKSPGDASTRLTAAERLQHLSPELSTAQAVERIDALSAEFGAIQLEARLKEWERQHVQMVTRLNAWIDTPGYRVRNIWVNAVDRRRAAQALMDSWRLTLSMPSELAADSQLNLASLSLGDLPELPVSFNHVATLDLGNVRLTAQGSNGFLRSFTHVRHLNLSDNRLGALPEAVQTLAQLTRLEARRNGLQNARALEQQLRGLTNLEWLDLGENALAEFDMTQMGRLHTLDLHGNVMADWPHGAMSAPALRALNLSNNQIGEVPAEMLMSTHAALAAGTDISDNLLFEEEAMRVRDHLLETGQGLGMTLDEIDRIVEGYAHTSDSDSESDAGHPDSEPDDVQKHRWFAQVPRDSEKHQVWDSLKADEGGEDFFFILSNLRHTKDFSQDPVDLTQRVWRVLDAAHSDDALRDELFERSRAMRNNATCGDGRILLFSELEIKAYEFTALKAIDPAHKGRELLKLSRGLFNLDQVDALARQVIAEKPRIDPAEIRLAYRIGLARRLDLPGQPKSMLYQNLAQVSPSDLERAYTTIVQAQGTPAFIEQLVTRPYWMTYLEEKYADDFTRLQQQLQARSEALELRYPDFGEAYFREVETLGNQGNTERQQLARDLSRREMTELG